MAKYYLPTQNLEPSYEKEVPASGYEITLALNWYNTNKSEKDAAKYLSCEVKNAKSHLTYAWVTRMRQRGFVFSESSQETIRKLQIAFAAEQPVIPETQNPEQQTVSIQDRIQAKTDQIIGDIEGSLVDEFGIRGDSSKMNAYEWMTSNDVKSIHAPKIVEFFQSKLEILENATKDPALKEYYSGYSKKEFLNLYQCYAHIISDAQKIASNAKLVRKPRKKKPISAEKQVAKLQYKQKDDSFKLQSVVPSNIVGASQLWVFNTKTRRLGVYSARDRGGLGVKGSTILNYAKETAVCKTLRKPEEVLNSVLSGGKVTLRKLMDGVNSKASEMNGRINKDTILLRVIYDK